MDSKEIKKAIQDSARPLIIGLRNDIKDLTETIKKGQTQSSEFLQMILETSNDTRK